MTMYAIFSESRVSNMTLTRHLVMTKTRRIQRQKDVLCMLYFWNAGDLLFLRRRASLKFNSCCIKGFLFDSPIILISLSHYWLVLYKLFVLTTDACPIALQWMSGLADFTEMLKSNVYRMNASGWGEMASYSTNTVCGNWISNVWQRDLHCDFWLADKRLDRHLRLFNHG